MSSSIGSFSPAQALIAAMITPALLILASGSLIATALVRLGRIMDRIRKLSEGASRPDTLELDRYERRAILAQRALSMLFGAILCFVLAGLSIAFDHASGDRFWWLPVSLTLIGMLLIVAGSALMLAECKLSTDQIHAEIANARTRTS
jgi:hypothetical protein